MVLRQLNFSAEETVKYVEDSVDKAKQAVQLDIKDGQSWCKNFFLWDKKMKYKIVLVMNKTAD